MIALDRRTGETVWQTDVPGGADDKSAETGGWVGSWSTPVIATVGGRDVILVAQSKRVNAYDPATGKIAWTCAGLGDLAYADVLLSDPIREGDGPAAAAGDKIGLATAGYGGAALAFRVPATAPADGKPLEGDITDARRLWRSEAKNPRASARA